MKTVPVVFNVYVFATQGSRMDGWTNTTHHIDLYDTHLDQKEKHRKADRQTNRKKEKRKSKCKCSTIVTFNESQGLPNWYQNIEFSGLYRRTKFERN